MNTRIMCFDYGESSFGTKTTDNNSFNNFIPSNDNNDKNKKNNDSIRALIILACILVIGFVIFYFGKMFYGYYYYEKGKEAYRNGEYDLAIQYFDAAGDYKDASECKKYVALAQSLRIQNHNDEIRSGLTVADTTAAETYTNNNTYDDNNYYEIVDSGSYSKSYGYEYYIDKVLARSTGEYTATAIAYASDGSVVGKSTCDFALIKDEYSFIKFQFDNEIGNATIEKSITKKSSNVSSYSPAVEMLSYNFSGSSVFITVKQIASDLDYFSEFKILFYKNDRIVGSEYGYFNIYAENLNGIDTTDVMEVSMYGIDADRIEFFFEP